MLLATSLNVFFDREISVCLEEGIERCARAGFDGVDFNFTDYEQMLERLVGRQDAGAYVRSLRAHAAKVGLKFVQVHGPIFDQFGDSAAIQPRVELSHECLRWAAGLGAPWVVFHPATCPGPFDHDHLEEIRRRNADFFLGLLDTARKQGVGIAIENVSDEPMAVQTGMRRLYCSTPSELVELVDTLGDPLVGVCWDTGHAYLQHLDQQRALQALGHRLKATHIQDNDGSSDQHLLPYHGRVAWSNVLRGLRDIRYSGAFCYEVHNAVRVLPDELRCDMLQYAARLGRYLLSL